MKRRDFLKRTLVGASFATAGASLRANLATPKEFLALAGTPSPSPSFYTRMFRDLPQATYSKESLEKLAKSMIDDPDNRRQRKSSPLAGYTYLGQFIDHDLTLDLTPLRSAQPDETQVRNFRSPFLDLDHVYGGGPNLSPHLYRKRGAGSPGGAERLLIGKVLEPDGKEGQEADLPRNSEGIALAGDPRQDENLILAQLHVAFLKFHNRVIEKSDWLKPYRTAGSDFAAAQRLVTWHYQWVVRHDYLESILDESVVKILGEIENKKRQNPHSDFKIPIEFSAAAFRFGHSMVRDEYFYNVTHFNAGLPQLLSNTRARLRDEWVIEWQHFFSKQDTCLWLEHGRIDNAQKINTKIAAGLYGLDIAQNVRPFSAPMAEVSSESAPDHGVQIEEERRLPVRTLWRGAAMKLPSGQEVAKALKLTPIPAEQIRKGLDQSILDLHPFDEDTPLWYYILKEAELPPNNGLRLGRVGSLIIADVIIGALAADPASYFSDPKGWKPTLPFKGDFGTADILCIA